MSAETPTARLFNDPRVDKGMTWALNLAMTVALGIGASFFNTLTQEMKGLQKELAALRVQIAVLETARPWEQRVRELEQKVAVLESRQPR